MIFVILGLASAGIYALIAIGMVSIYQSSRVFNLAHGPIVILAGYSTILAINHLDVGLSIGFLVALVVGVTATWLLYVVVFLRLRAHHLSAMIASFALGSGIVAILLRLVNSGEAISLDAAVRPEWSIDIGGVVLSSGSILALSIAVVSLAVLALIAKRSSFGMALRAVADTEHGATISGISPGAMYRYSFLIAGVSAGIAGFVIAVQFAAVGADAALNLMIKGLAAALLGGMSRYSGAMLGALAIGLIEALAAGKLSGGIAPIITNGLIICLLVWRPAGLLKA